MSRVTRHSINLLKENYRNDLKKEDWMLLIRLKQKFGIL